MAQIDQPIKADGVVGYEFSQATESFVINYRSDPPLRVEVQSHHVMDMVRGLVAAHARIHPQGKMQPGEITVINTDWWQLLPLEDGGFVLGLRLTDAGFLHFHLSPTMVSGLAEYLSQAVPASSTAQNNSTLT